jgi:hypothetical protein
LHLTKDDDYNDNYNVLQQKMPSLLRTHTKEIKVEDAKSLTNHGGDQSITARSERLAGLRLAQSFGRKETHKPLSRGHCATRQSTR